MSYFISEYQNWRVLRVSRERLKVLKWSTFIWTYFYQLRQAIKDAMMNTSLPKVYDQKARICTCDRKWVKLLLHWIRHHTKHTFSCYREIISQIDCRFPPPPIYSVSQIHSSSMALQPFVGPWPLLQFRNHFTQTPWTEDQPVTRPLPTHGTTQTQNKRTQTYLPRLGFESTTAVYEQAKIIRALDCANCGPYSWTKLVMKHASSLSVLIWRVNIESSVSEP
jgi:hypothetical protein